MNASPVSTLPAVAPAPVAARPVAGFSLAPRSFDEMMTFATMIAKSDFAPKDYKGKPENVMIAMQMGHELGLHPLQAVQNIAVINGRPAVWGDALLAIAQAHPDFADITERLDGTGDAQVARCTIQRRGRSETARSFSVADAKKAGLWNKAGPWTQYPQRMLQMRARAFALRDAFADALRGISVREEAQDIPAEKNVTPAPAAPRVTLDSVLQDIKAADSIEELKALADKAAQLTDELDKAEARAAYKRRKNEITGYTPPAVPPESAPDITDVEPLPTGDISVASVIAQMRATTSVDAADVVLDLMNAPHFTAVDRQAIGVAYQAKLAEFEKAAGDSGLV